MKSVLSYFLLGSLRFEKKTRFAASLSTLHELDLPLQSTVCHFFHTFDRSTCKLITVKCPWSLTSFNGEWNGNEERKKSTHLENERWKGISRPRLEVSASQLSPLFFFCVARPTKPAPDPSAAWCKNEVRRSKTDSWLPAAFLSSSWSDKKISLTLSNWGSKFTKKNTCLSNYNCFGSCHVHKLELGAHERAVLGISCCCRKFSLYLFCLEIGFSPTPIKFAWCLMRPESRVVTH